MSAAKRRSNLPKTLVGQTYCYDKDTLIMPVEIRPRSPHWKVVPENQRHTRNYRLMYLPSGVKGKHVYTHDQLVDLLRGKSEYDRLINGCMRHVSIGSI